MAFSQTAIAKAETDARTQFGVECKYNQASSVWYKVVAGVVTPFNLSVPTERAMRDWCRQALLQADYDERNAPPPPGGNGPGFWDTLLGDADVRNAVQNAVPQSIRPFVTPLLNAAQGALGGGGAPMSAAMQTVAKAGIAGAGGFALGRAAGTSGVLSGAGSAIGMVAGGPLGAAIGGAIGVVIEKGFMAAADNVREMRSLGAKSVENLTGGALSLTGRAFDVGLQIGDTLLRAALRPFGASGGALAGFASVVGRSVTGVVMSGLGVAAGGLKLAGGLAAGGAGLALGLGGFVLGGGGIGGIIGMVVATAVGKALMQVANVVTGIIGGVFDHLGKALGELGKIGGAALNSLIQILDDVKNAALGLSKSILDLSQQSGLSVGVSAEAVNNLAGFNVAPAQTAAMFSQNALYTRAKDAAWGIGGEPGSAQNLRETRSMFQELLRQGNGNPLIANMMMQQTGKGALIPMANLPSSTFERSLSNGAGLQMGAGAVLRWQQDFSLMQADLSRFADFVKVTLGNAFLPAMQKGLGMAVSFFKTHKDEIVAGIKDIGRFAYAVLPAMVMDVGIAVVGAFSYITKGMANMLRGFSDGKGIIHDFIHGFLGGIDKIVAGLIKAGQIGAAAFAFSVGGPLAAGAAYWAAGKFFGKHQTTLAGDFDKATARQYDAQGRPIKTAADKATDWLDARGDQLDGIGKLLSNARSEWDVSGRSKEFEGLFQVMQKIEENTGRKQELNANINVQISPQEDFLAKVLSYDQWMTWQTLGNQAA